MTQVRTVSAGFTYERGFLHQYQCLGCGEWSRNNFGQDEQEKDNKCWEEVHARCTCPKEQAAPTVRTYQHKRKK